MSTSAWRFITKKEVCSTLGISRATLERLVADKRFPKPFKVGTRAVRWRSDETEEYINRLTRIEEAYSCRTQKNEGAEVRQ